ncbi:MAG: glutathione S-transferase family protein [Myxococcota bacterium]
MPQVANPRSPLVGQLRGVHLFHFEGAPCAQRVRFALAEKGLTRGKEVPWSSAAPETLAAESGTWTSRHVSLIKKQHLTEAYAAIQPNMVVPALVHDGRLYIESMDILEYLDQAWPEAPLMPEDPAAAAHARELIEWGKQLHVSVRYVSFRWGLGRLARLDPKSERKLEELEREGSPEKLGEFYRRYDRGEIEDATYREHLAALEHGYATLDELLERDGRPFLTGPAFSAADIIWSIKVLRIHECGYPFARNFPALHAWYERVSQRRGFQEGVMARHRHLSRAFRIKAAVENLLGVGLRGVSRERAVAS